MKKITRGISRTAQWAIAVFLGLGTVGAFMENMGAGICWLIAALLMCPKSRGALAKWLAGKNGFPLRKWLFKKEKAEFKGVLVGVLAFACLCSGAEALPEALVSGTEMEDVSCSEVEVHFIDVGQGDATLIKADGHYMLIDAGDNSKGTTVQQYLKKQGVEKLDYLILTHTDADHIGGADVIVSKFDIDNIFIGDYEKDNNTYEELIDAIQYKDYRYSVPEVGTEYQLGNAAFTILAPNTTYDDPNNNSIALILKNGDNTFLFSGDCEADAEEDILANGLSIDVDVYKVGHHGSSTSSSKTFLDAMTPMYGVISCEEGNSYGHPHSETLNNLRAMGVKVFRTDEQGSIIAYSDGNTITWNCAASESWQAGEATRSSLPSVDTNTGRYAVNANNGKIHRVGECSATGTDSSAMKNSVYFGTYEEAEAYSLKIAPSQDKRKCGNCW